MGAMIENVVIVEAVRSAVGRAHKGSLAQTRPDELAGQVIAGLLARVPGVKAADIEELTLGCAMPEGEQGLNVARTIGLLAGCPSSRARRPSTASARAGCRRSPSRPAPSRPAPTTWSSPAVSNR